MAKAKAKSKPAKSKLVYLIASGDLRQSANLVCQEAQQAMEAKVIAAVEKLGAKVKRAHPVDNGNGHGFIDSQKYGMQVFRDIPEDAPLIVAEAVWQYSHHVLAGLLTHKGPILTVANWSGQWPGLVGMLNLNGGLTKAGKAYSSLWSETLEDDAFTKKLKGWLETGKVKHDLSHVVPAAKAKLAKDAMKIGEKFAVEFKKNKAIMGVFDEGCMGMYNAIIPDELMQETGVFKERLSQSALYYKATTVSDADAKKVYQWYLDRGVKFQFGKNEESELTESQVLWQCKTYIAAVRIAHEFGCAVIGIQYQQGLKDLLPASDLVEGTLNSVERPPVFDEKTGEELFKGEAIPHFNEVDECAGLDGLVTYHLWRKLGYSPENTLHDLRWGRHYKGPGQYADGKEGVDDYVWVFEISGAVPPAHFIDGWKGASSERQPSMYFRLGGGTLKGISKPGYIVWSRVYVDRGLKMDIGVGEVVKLPQAETEDRWKLTTSQWPIMHAVLNGVSRDQMMAKHKSNHIQVVYAPGKAEAKRALAAKVAAFQALGVQVNVCGRI